MMRHLMISYTASCALLSIATLLTVQPALAKDKLPAATPAKPQAAVCDKLKALSEHLGRALDVALDLFSGNQADLLSKNNAALLSGNSPHDILSGTKGNMMSDNKPTVLSGNQTPIMSGNTFNLLSNIKVEIHIENAGNTATAPLPTANGTDSRRTLAPR